MNDIKAWLTGTREYVKGVSLYEKYGSSRVLKTVFAKGISSVNSARLLQELIRLSETKHEVITEAKKLKETGIYTGDDFSQLPQAVQLLINRAKDKYKEIANWKSKLNILYLNSHQFPDIKRKNEYMLLAGAGDIANTILDLDDERADLLFQIDFFRREGRLPDAPQDPEQTLLEMTEGEIRSEIQRLRPQVSKNKNKEMRAGEVAAWRLRLAQLERRLDELV